MSRPTASTSAIRAPPALPSDMKTSNGWRLSSSVIVTYIVPSGDSTRRVLPCPGCCILRDLFRGRAGGQHLILARAVAVHRHALAAQLVSVAVDLLDVLLGCVIRKVAG